MEEEYPFGPYGLEVGDTIANYEFCTFWGRVSMARLRSDPISDFLLLPVSMPGCFSCAILLREMDLLIKGGWEAMVFALLLSGYDEADLDVGMAYFQGMSFGWGLLDPVDGMGRDLGSGSGRSWRVRFPSIYVVRLADMKIVAIKSGYPKEGVARWYDSVVGSDWR